ncbi:hypothetical protein RND71_004162 [Anisodus tanguticus]|uniref:VQ domain-containing protein n=1 Tax=Anisodus tanguticus TaxID=243964 RepID=A0AAE1SY41_9SOLA|nr:hypothetical protein RND71_004162 [Anisodus tanguticus]
MASYDNLITMEQWGFRSTFNDSWFPDLFAKETETLTKVLQKSYNSDVMPTVEMTSPTFFQTPSASGPTVSGGSENETAVSKRRSNGGGGGGGGGVSNKKIVKRKPRASKRPSTTYITADVDSFRQMVQQVTGVSNGHVTVCSILKPEPRRPVDLVQPVCCLPTLDTSAFLLDPTSSFMQPPLAAAGCVAVSHLPSPVVVDGGYGFDYFSGFPTLESGI